MLNACVATVFVSATLLFVVQPMFARMVLPLLGGSPAVWNTALVFYQVALLAGYGYAHLTTSRLGPRAQVALHGTLMLAAILCLPLMLPAGWTPPVDRNPVPWMLGVMTLRIGLPFLVVSSTGPLIQKWFAATRHRLAPDPYFLYAASNLGSMIGLLSYPVLVEPHLPLAQQSRLWTAGYVLLVALTAVCATLRLRAPRNEAAGPEPAAASSPPAAAASPGFRRPLRWVALAFAPASLMMAATTHLTTDVAAVPLLWVVPLAIYLLTFILVFARRPPIAHETVVDILPVAVLALVLIILAHPSEHLLLVVISHLAVLFFAAMACHGELAKDRPGAAHLTEFYLWMSVGGALGGVFNAIVAPVAFDSVVEYPVALALACLLMPAAAPGTRRTRVLDVVLPVSLAALVMAAVAALDRLGIDITRAMVIVGTGVLVFVVYTFARRPVRLALGVAALLFTNPEALENQQRMLHVDRSFFGINRVLVDPTGAVRELWHGTTLHGEQRVRPPGCRAPLGYYDPTGPLGDLFAAQARRGPGTAVGITGLGVGAIAGYAGAGERWTYYEIDPAVHAIASDPKLFCFLSESPATPRVVLGDARVALAASPERYDLLIMDAYTSDAIPVHLLTREAMRIYLERLAPHGMLAFHISNRYFDLAPVVAKLASDAGLAYRVANIGRAGRAAVGPGWTESTWCVVARDATDLGPLRGWGNWITPSGRGTGVWTDEFASLFSVLRKP